MADYERVPGGKRLPTSLNSEEEWKVNVIIFSHFDSLERETWFYFFSHFLVPYRLLCIFIFVFRYKLAVADYERVPGCRRRAEDKHYCFFCIVISYVCTLRLLPLFLCTIKKFLFMLLDDVLIVWASWAKPRGARVWRQFDSFWRFFGLILWNWGDI